MLHSVEVKNFKKHSSITAEFKPGLNFVVGANYRGKTSLLESILFALGGVASVPGGSSVAFKRGTKQTSVKTSFGEYTVERTRTGANLSDASGPVATGKTAVNERMDQLIGLSPKDFMKVCYLQQGSASQLVSELGASEVNRLVETVSGVSEVDTYLTIIRDLSARAAGQLEAFHVDPDRQKHLERQILQLTKEVESYTQTLERLEKGRTEGVDAQEALQKAQALLREVGYLKGLLNTELKTEEGAKARVAEVRAELAALPVAGYEQETLLNDQRQKAQQDAEELEKKYLASIKAEKEYSLAQARKVDLRGRVIKLEQELGTLDLSEESLQAELEELEQKSLDIQQATAVLKGEIKASEAAIEGGSCPTCGRQYDDCDFDPTTLKQDLELRKEALSEAMLTYQDTRGEMSSVTDDLRKVKGVRKDIAHFTSLLEHLQEPVSLPEFVTEETVQAARASAREAHERFVEASEIRKKVEACESRLAKELAHLEKCTESVVAGRRDYARMKERLEKQPPKIAALSSDEIEEKLLSVKRDLDEMTNGILEVTDAISNRRRRLDADKNEHKQLLRDLKKIKELKTREAQLKKLRKFLTENRARYLDQVWNSVLGYTSEVCKVTTGGAITRVMRDGGDFFYEEGDQMLPIQAASGSQKSLIGAGLKMALTKSLPAGIDFILMDEPTSDCDEKHSSALMRFLSGCGLQALVVTHRELDMAMGGNVIELGPT